MEGVIANFRRGRHVQTGNHIIVYLANKSDSEKLVGKKVVWKSDNGKEFLGKVASTHGNNGALRVIFERGLPGQSLGTKVQIV